MTASPRRAALALAGAVLVAGASGFSGAALAPTPSAEGDRDPRPVVLMLHGRGLTGFDTAGLRMEWLGALNSGLHAVGAGPLLLTEDDLRVIWYADALDPRAPVGCVAARAAAQERAASRPGGEIAAAMAATGALLAFAAEWARGPEGEALRALAGDLLYFGDDEKRCAAERRLDEALRRAAFQGRPVILVAHSFGSLVAHGHLRTREADAPVVERYLTIGSLIGRPELRTLLIGPAGREPGLPPGVRSWVNVRDPRDPLATALLGVRAPSDQEARIFDLRTERTVPGDPHDAGRYLSDPATARAVLGAWCSGLGQGARATPACATSVASPLREERQVQ